MALALLYSLIDAGSIWNSLRCHENHDIILESNMIPSKIQIYDTIHNLFIGLYNKSIGFSMRPDFS